MPASLRSEGVRVHPGMLFGFPPELAFSFAGIPRWTGIRSLEGICSHLAPLNPAMFVPDASCAFAVAGVTPTGTFRICRWHAEQGGQDCNQGKFHDRHFVRFRLSSVDIRKPAIGGHFKTSLRS
jgi:hypothetical protein